ncbi:MAG: DeoR/GlpR family DNA-binding transcription regulator, partial [Verrucomicrobiota bacterium]
MKRSNKEIAARRDALAEWIRDKGYQPVPELARRFKVSEVTMRRDLKALELERRVTRTHGGALVDDNLRFAIFGVRVGVNPERKREIGKQAVQLLQSGMSMYMDAGTTIYAVAQELKTSKLQNIRIMTPSIPIAELMAEVSGIQVFLTGGNVLAKRSCLVGDLSEVSISQWDFDIALLGAEGIDDTGLWNSNEGLVRQQRRIIRNTENIVYCLDPSKSHQSGPIFICRWEPRFRLISGA